MLSKKQAKTFFIAGSLVTFFIFIGLTIFSLSKSQDQSNSDKITESVAHGKHLWEKNNCMGCHTLMGEGAYYAPELTNVIKRRGEVYVKTLLKMKTPWAPRGRKMVAYGFSDEEANDLIAFLKWVGEINLNGFEKVDRTVSPLPKDKMKN